MICVLQKHRSLFLRLRFTISLLEVVVDETKIQLNDENCSNETRDVCKKFLADLADLNVAYARNRPRYLRQAYLKNDDAARRASGGRHSRKCVGRGPSSLNATVSYVRRRNQQVAVDETLQTIDHFTDSWKKELEWRSSADGDETRSNLGQRAEEDGDDDRSCGGHSSMESRVRNPAETRDKCERFRQPSPPAQVDPQGQQQLRSFAGLNILPGPNEDRDLDFEKSVLAYRRAKQAVYSVRSLDDERPSSASHPRSPLSVTHSSPSRSASPSSSTNAESRPPNVSAEPSRPKPKKKINGDRVFDNYLARSTVEMRKKFQPEELRF